MRVLYWQEEEGLKMPELDPNTKKYLEHKEIFDKLTEYYRAQKWDLVNGYAFMLSREAAKLFSKTLAK